MAVQEKKLVRLGRSLAEFFAPRDWIPSIPLPPVGRWEPKGPGCMQLVDAIEGFPDVKK